MYKSEYYIFTKIIFLGGSYSISGLNQVGVRLYQNWLQRIQLGTSYTQMRLSNDVEKYHRHAKATSII